jgi:hypothetical protein|tara:strand:- start:61 stop:327 length:267 start_codon:yes stop_codon:yes gene_type:complete
MSTKEIKQELPKWFKGSVYSKGDVVANRFTGEECELNNIELSMYDFVMGSCIARELGMTMTSKDIDEFEKGLRWFMKNNPRAYMILLD